jgi:hypothetical protein
MKQHHQVQLTPEVSFTTFLSTPKSVVLTITPTFFFPSHPFVLSPVSPHQSALFTKYLYELQLSYAWEKQLVTWSEVNEYQVHWSIKFMGKLVFE